MQQTFNLSLEEDVLLQLFRMSVRHWGKISPESLRELANSSVSDIRRAIAINILENYNQIPKKYRDVYLEALYSPDNVKALLDYISLNRREFDAVSDNVLIKLLTAPGIVQYEVLPALLNRYDRLSKKSRKIVDNLIDNPPDWWVAASVGQTTEEDFNEESSEKIEGFLLRIINRQEKRAIGALLAEIAQNYLDDGIGLQEKYLPLLHRLIADSEAVKYAENWMDYSSKAFDFGDDEYWSDIKKRMRSLAEELDKNQPDNR